MFKVGPQICFDSDSGGSSNSGDDARGTAKQRGKNNAGVGKGATPSLDTASQVDSFQAFTTPDKPKGFDPGRGRPLGGGSLLDGPPPDTDASETLSISIKDAAKKAEKDKAEANRVNSLRQMARTHAAERKESIGYANLNTGSGSLVPDYDPVDDDYDGTYTLADVTREQADRTSFYNLSSVEKAQKDSEDIGSKIASLIGIGSEPEYTKGAGWEEGTQFSAASFANSHIGGPLISAAIGLVPALAVRAGLNKLENLNKPEVKDYTHDYESWENRAKSFAQHPFGPNPKYDPHGANGLPPDTFGDNNSASADLQKGQQSSAGNVALKNAPSSGGTASTTPPKTPPKSTTSNGTQDDDLYSLYRRMLGGYFKRAGA